MTVPYNLPGNKTSQGVHEKFDDSSVIDGGKVSDVEEAIRATGSSIEYFTIDFHTRYSSGEVTVCVAHSATCLIPHNAMP